MAEHWGKEGSAGMQGPLRGPLRVCFVIWWLGAPPAPQQPEISGGKESKKRWGAEGGGDGGARLWATSLTGKSEPCTAPQVSVCGGGGGAGAGRAESKNTR